MGLRDLAKRLRTEPEQLEHERLQRRFAALDTTPIGAVACRHHARIAGEVKRIRVAPRQGIPALEVVVGDGTGDAVAIFTGRRPIAGIEHGRAMIVEGVPRDDHGRKAILNPAYTLLPH